MTVTMKLEYPVKAEGRLLSEVNLRRPKVRDIEAVDSFKNEVEQSIHLIANLAEIAPETVRELDIADFNRVNAAVIEFMGKDKGSALATSSR